jgi:phospholipase/lecithinase/hemolysin
MKALRVLLACMVSALPIQGPAALFSDIIVLGDSLSDQGNLYAATSTIAGGAIALPAADHYFNGRFSNGPVYTDVVAQRLGLSLGPSIFGGKNFAYGGARTTYNTVETTVGGLFPPGLFPWSLNAEVSAFTSRGMSDPNALYIVFSGSNDVADILTRGLDPGTVISTTVGGIISAVQAFKAAGARTVVVPNIPDLGLTPAFSGNSSASAAATALSVQFNALLHAQLGATTGVNIIEFDTFDFLRTLVANPISFGLTNVTQPCYSGFVLPNPIGTECSNPGEFLFWDLVHPTSTVHLAIADALLAAIPSAVVPEPSTLVLLALALAVCVGRIRTSLRVPSLRNGRELAIPPNI